MKGSGGLGVVKGFTDHLLRKRQIGFSPHVNLVGKGFLGSCIERYSRLRPRGAVMHLPCLPQALEGHQAQERPEAQSQAFAIPERILLRRAKQLAIHCFPPWLLKKVEVISIIKNYFEIFTIHIFFKIYNLWKRTTAEVLTGMSQRRVKGGILKLFLTSTSASPTFLVFPRARGLTRSWVVLQQVCGFCNGTAWGRGKEKRQRFQNQANVSDPKDKQVSQCDACINRKNGDSVSWTWTSKALWINW